MYKATGGPLKFYGVVVDQNDQPVNVRLGVASSCRVCPEPETGIRKTDARRMRMLCQGSEVIDRHG